MDSTKINVVLEYMKNGGRITDKIAVDICQSYRLSSIIFELRHTRGLNIQDRWITNENTGTRYKEYWLVE